MPVFYTPIPQNLRVGLAHASSAIFINNRTRDSGYLKGHGVENEVSSKVSSHLPLQMFLYFNMFFFPFWWLSEIVMLDLKFTLLPGYYQCLMVVGMIIISVLEVLRVYLGYVGNLKEKVPELAAFWLISLAFQLPILLFFLTDEGLLILPLERVMHSLYLAFLLGEVLSSFVALRVMTRKLALQFHLRQFRPVDTSSMFSFSCGNRSVLPVLPVRNVQPQ
ncbi:transmembrane protein 17A [Pangasianodon hypophthalmus]|uniref:transmembrane protein 17A n=1 Tax=Pangasianodon hypophthalmus TaxID=310915 RepID=UPI000EFE36CF|nr:transmembrane protein 17A [Pangasianodon hypophthalmus]